MPRAHAVPPAPLADVRTQQMSPGLKRARAPFFLRNTVTGTVLAAFAVGIWAYSMRAVKQDDFSDVDEEARALARAAPAPAPASAPAAVEGAQTTAPGAGVVPVPVEPAAVVPVVAQPVHAGPSPRGVLASLVHERYPRLLDPTTKTFVWGAPSVDRLGRMGEAASRK